MRPLQVPASLAPLGPSAYPTQPHAQNAVRAPMLLNPAPLLVSHVLLGRTALQTPAYAPHVEQAPSALLSMQPASLPVCLAFQVISLPLWVQALRAHASLVLQVHTRFLAPLHVFLVLLVYITLCLQVLALSHASSVQQALGLMPQEPNH